MADLYEPPPDGGALAWFQVLGSFLVVFNNWGFVNSWGVYQAFYAREYLHDESVSSISWIGTVAPALLIMVSVISGPIFDRGYFRLMLVIGSLGLTFGIVMLSFCNEYYQIFLTQGLIVGISSGILYIPSLACLSTYFTTKRGLAVGIALSGSSIGGMVYPIVFRRLEPTIGFPWATRVVGFIVAGTLGLSILMLKPRIKPGQNSRRRLFDKSAFTDVPFMLFTAGFFFAFSGYYVPIFLEPTFAVHQVKQSEGIAFYLIALLNGASVVGRVVPGLIADRIGPMRVLIFGFLAGGLISLGWIGVKNFAGLIVFCTFYGLFGGLIPTMPATAISALCPSLDVVGTRMGMAFFPAGIGVLLSTPVAGALATASSDGFLGAQLWAGLILLLAGSFEVFALLRLNRQEKLIESRSSSEDGEPRCMKS